MAGGLSRRRFYNLIWILLLLALVLLPLLSMDQPATSLALEQEAQCGLAEHIHTEQCYSGNVLLCGQKAHTHSEGCYLVLLKDNDINYLVQMIGSTGEHTLDSVVRSALRQALTLNQRFDPGASPLSLSREDIAAVNTTIAANHIQPAVVLNEDAASGSGLAYDLAASGGVESYALGEVGTGSVANCYIWVADQSRFISIGYVDIAYNSSSYSWSQYYYVEKSAVAALYQTAQVISDVTASSLENSYYDGTAGYQLQYTTNAPSETVNSFTTSAYQVYGNSDRINMSNNSGPVYMVLSTGTASGSYSYSYTPVDFCTVTLLSPDGSTLRTIYVQSGQAFALPDDYAQWYDTADPEQTYSAGASVTVSGAATFQAVSDQYTVTFISNGKTYARTLVDSGAAVAAPSPEPSWEGHIFGGWYPDTEYELAYDFSSPVDGNLTLFAKWTAVQCQVTWSDADGNRIKADQTVDYGDTVQLPTGYRWSDGTSGYAGGDEVTIKQDTDFVGTLIRYSITVRDENGTGTVRQGGYGETLTLDTLPSGYVWVGSDGSIYSGGSTTAPIYQDLEFTATQYVKATYSYMDGTVETSSSVTPGSAVTLPSLSDGRRWRDEKGNGYAGGESVTLTADMTFTEATALTVHYTVGFPETVRFDGYTATPEAVPTLKGDNDTPVTEGGTAVLMNVSSQNVPAVFTINNSSRYYTVHFEGWLAEDGTTLLSPGTNLDWSLLSGYDADGDGTVELTGKWVYHDYTSANFFIKYNSKPDGNTNKEAYTDVVFQTYVGGINTSATVSQLNAAHAITEDTFQEDFGYTPSYLELDEQISSLEGYKSGSAWLTQFPDDEAMFQVLSSLTDDLQVEYPDNPGQFLSVDEDGTQTPDDPTDDLNEKNYAIRWYMFKLVTEGGNVYTWHIDGLLVKKQGQITVDKTFSGNEAAIGAASDIFYILARNGVKNDDGSFTPYDSTNASFKEYVLVLDEAVGTALQTTYPDAQVLVYDPAGSDTANNNYEWLISGVALGEYWQITEYADPVTVNGVKYIYYAECSVRDTDGNATAVAEYGTTASVIGKTYALDEDPDQGLLVDFRNYYYPSDTLLIKKEDSNTGESLGGAEFELWHSSNGGILKRLRFTLDQNTGLYRFDNDGALTSLSTGTSGYINIAGFSYEHGRLLLREVTAPTGYDTAPDVEIMETVEGVGLSSVYYPTGDTIAAADWSQYAEVNADGAVLVVKDHSTEYVSVKVTKQWDPVDAAVEKVVLVLQANDSRATGTFPALGNVEVTLDAKGAYTALDSSGSPVYLDGGGPWSYTWTDLPAYANGALVRWSVKEIVIGSDPTLTDGESFANWTYTCVLTDRKDTNGDGTYDASDFVLTNTERRTQIILTKTDGEGVALAGAEFTLEEVTLSGGQWQSASGATVYTQTTDSGGVIRFDALTAGAYYRLTETSVPEGYICLQHSVVLTVDGEGNVQQVSTDGTRGELSGSTIRCTRAYNIQVINYASVSLPETGGVGLYGYLQTGMALLAAAFVLLYMKNARRKEGQDSS